MLVAGVSLFTMALGRYTLVAQTAILYPSEVVAERCIIGTLHCYEYGPLPGHPRRYLAGALQRRLVPVPKASWLYIGAGWELRVTLSCLCS